jgi:iron-sulfur cluster assembly protein
MLDGVTIDFSDTPTASGPDLLQPERRACGCSSAGPAKAPAEARISLSSIKRL